MSLITTQHYFDLSNFTHKKIFSLDKPIWKALDELHNYLINNNLEKKEVVVPRGTFIENPELVTIGTDTIIEPGAFIRGPCIIGNNCTIRHGAYLRGDVLIGDNCVVGHDTEIKNTIFLNNVQAGHFNYIGDSILGNNVNLGAGAKCANLRLDHKEIYVIIEGEKIATGRRKLGSIIGDNSQLGCNCVANPGTILGKNVFCHPCVNFGGYVPSGKIVHNPDRFIIS